MENIIININYWAVLVAAVVAYVVAWAWYSPALFMRPWMRLAGVHADDMHKGGTAKMVQSMAVMFVCNLVTAYVLAHLIVAVGATTVSMAMQVGLWVWLGFYATMQLGPWLWEGKAFQLYYIQAGQTLVTTLVMAAILGGWQ